MTSSHTDGSQAHGCMQQPRVALVCPHCTTPLVNDNSRIVCTRCSNTWPVVHGIPQFVTDFPYWGEIPLELMGAVLRSAKDNWQSALVASPEPAVRQAAEMITNVERANWQWLLDLGSDSRVLDIGAGMGANSHALALHYRDVFAVEPVFERVEFMRYRFAQEHLNVTLLRGSVWDLPFSNSTFDLVAMNGVLEWVATGRTEDPGELQARAVKRVFELLRPGGYFYVGIENRTAYGSFIGYRDPHCGVPFVTILPRPLAHWYARRYGLPGYRQYLYSSSGYRRLMKDAGFRSVEIYLALPSYNHPRYLIPLKNNLFSYYLRNFTSAPRNAARHILHNVLQHLGVLKEMQYSYVIIAQK